MATLGPFHALSVAACWKLARQEAQAYQRRANRVLAFPPEERRIVTHRALCLAARDAADRIALMIRYGRRRGRRRK